MQRVQWGPKICSHNREKNRCKKCEGSPKYALITGKKNHCKKCSDPIKITIKQWIFNRRQYDKKRNIYDADRFMDKCFLKGLIEDYKQCYYGDCKINLQYTEYQNDLATIERLDNSIGPYQEQLRFLCCLKCNNLKKSNNLIYLS